MPRRDGDVFLLGTAISVSSRGIVGGIIRWTRTAQRLKARTGMPIKAALIEDGVAQS
jgi:hypothetical protein